jgi:hypothetical protein
MFESIGSSRYENPWLLAADRDTIVDIHTLLTKMTTLGSHTRPFDFILGEQGFVRPIQVWSEVGEICEAENFGQPSLITLSHLKSNQFGDTRRK